MTEQDLRNAMKLDAAWQRADAQFHAACEVHDGAETSRQRRARRQREFDADPERMKRRNAQRRAQRRQNTQNTQNTETQNVRCDNP